MAVSERPFGPPSPCRGARQALRLRQLVAAVWVASWLAIAPVLLVLSQTAGRSLAAVPGGPGEVAAGDLPLLMVEAVRGALKPLAIALVSGLAAWWAWTVLWHAGVVRWQLGTGAAPIRLGALLRLGAGRWWRYARLSATALAALAVAAAAVLAPLGRCAVGALGAMAERCLLVLLGIGATATALLAIAVWLATLRGAWLLGLPGRRSAVLAWLAGLRETLRRPLPGLWAWLVWMVPALLVSAVAPLLGAAFVGLRGGLLLVMIGLLASLARAFCWVGLFCSFAPLTDLVGGAEGPLEAAAGSPQQEIMCAEEAWQEEDDEGDPPAR